MLTTTQRIPPLRIPPGGVQPSLINILLINTLLINTLLDPGPLGLQYHRTTPRQLSLNQSAPQILITSISYCLETCIS